MNTCPLEVAYGHGGPTRYCNRPSHPGETWCTAHLVEWGRIPAPTRAIPLHYAPRRPLSARAVAAAAMASRGNTLRPAGVLIPETPHEARAEYVDARERGETVKRALSRARAEMVAHRVLTNNYDNTGRPWSDHLDAYDVDPAQLARVTSDRRTAVLAGEVRDADTGALILHPVVLPEGATARVYVYDDDDADVSGECYDDGPREAFGESWAFVGVTAVVTLADGARGEASLWGVEMGDYWPGSEAAQVWHAIPGLVSEAASEAADAEPDPENIPEDDRATCGTCHRSWNARTLPTPAGRCPREHDHEDADERTCDRHGGTWGDEPTCPKCTTPDGEPRDYVETPAENLAAWVRGIVDELDPEGTEHNENHDPDDAGGVGTCPACWGDRIREVLDARDETREA